MPNKVKIICTIGPASDNPSILKVLKEKKIDFFRINLSHTNEQDVEEKIKNLKPYGIPIIIDTEGPQVRTGNSAEIDFFQGDKVKLHAKEIECDSKNMFLTPLSVLNDLKVGDEVSLAFGSAHFCVCDTLNLVNKGYIECIVMSSGKVGDRKAVYIGGPGVFLPEFSGKDMGAIELAKKHSVKHFTLSFMESSESIRKIRKLYPNAVLYAKIESKKGLENFEEILKESDGILIDRGDLSSQIPIQKIPLIQKNLIKKCISNGKEIFVATDTLQNMFSTLRPNAADANDMVNTLLDGATGIALTKETAVGKYPIETVEMLGKIINQVNYIKSFDNLHDTEMIKTILSNSEL